MRGTRCLITRKRWNNLPLATGLPGRNNIPLSELDGVPVNLPDVVYSKMLGRISDYIDSKEIQLTKDTAISLENLPEGEYKIRFVVRDIFNAPHYSDYVSLKWDGETASAYQVQ